MVTRGQRRIGRTIRKLENSVEFSVKESKAKESERKQKNEKRAELALEDSPVQNLRYLIQKEKSKNLS